MELNAAFELAQKLVAEHGLHAWRVRFDTAKRRAGLCDHNPRTLSLSAPLTRLHSEAEVRETVLHEIAHALAGPRAGHGPAWRAVALRIGSNGERCLSHEAPSVPTDWVGVCPAGHTVGRHRRPRSVATCSQCSSRFDLAHLLTWTHRGQPGPMLPSYTAELERLRSGREQQRLAPGTRVVVTASGAHEGARGRIIKVTRANYHVQTRGNVLRVPFHLVRPSGRRAARG